MTPTLLAGNVGVTDRRGDEAEAAEAVVEKTKFRQMWIEAEHSHPVLTAYRHGGDIFQVDLGDLDTGSVDDEMRAVLMHVLPKLEDMIEAHDKLRSGDMSPLSIPTVVAMTKTNMFVPKDSIRDGIANDMAEEEGTESKWVILGAILLALVTFFPSGGASLGIVAGMASVGLATYSAVHEWEKYSKQKMLSDTNLDIAHSLATEEPSLTPFIFSLVALGLEPIPLAASARSTRRGRLKRRSSTRATTARRRGRQRAQRLIDQQSRQARPRGGGARGHPGRAAGIESGQGVEDSHRGAGGAEGGLRVRQQGRGPRERARGVLGHQRCGPRAV